MSRKYDSESFTNQEISEILSETQRRVSEAEKETPLTAAFYISGPATVFGFGFIGLGFWESYRWIAYAFWAFAIFNIFVYVRNLRKEYTRAYRRDTVRVGGRVLRRALQKKKTRVSLQKAEEIFQKLSKP